MKIMKIDGKFVLREVGGVFVAVPVGEKSKEFHGMINLNSTGAWLWRYFTEDHTVEEAVAAFTQDFEIDESIAKKDVEKFVSILQENNIIRL